MMRTHYGHEGQARILVADWDRTNALMLSEILNKNGAIDPQSASQPGPGSAYAGQPRQPKSADRADTSVTLRRALL